MRAPLIAPSPQFDRGILAFRLGELFGVNPNKLTDYSVEGEGGSPDVTVMIEARMTIPLDQFNAILREARL